LLAVLNFAFFPALWGNRTLMTSAGETASLYLTGAKPTAAPGVGPRTPDPGAPGWQFEPAMAFNGREIFHHHRFPRWNPYVAYGSPWAADMLVQPAFPLALLPELIPSPRVISWFVILRLFIAGIFAFLFMRYWTTFLASTVAAIAFMLTGYFILFLNVDHLSTEILVSVVFWSFERMYRTPSSRGVLPASVVIMLAIVAGMPESTLMILSFGYIYYVFRALSDRSVQITKAFGRLIAANVLGFGMGAFLLLPMWEFLQNGFDAHRIPGNPPGIISVSDPRGVLLFLVPLIFGRFGTPMISAFAGGSGLFGYFGLGPVILAVLAALSFVRGRRDWDASQRKILVFFLICVPLFMMKHWGAPVVNWIGRLPLFGLVIFPKYIQPLLGFALACVAGFGATKFLSPKFIIESWISIVAVLAATVILFRSYRVFLYGGSARDVHYIFTVLVVALLWLFVWVALLANAHWPAVRRYVPGLLVLLIAAELTANYVIPVYYLLGELSTNDRNPYAGAPYIDFLESKRMDFYRVFAQGGLLYPNWSSAYSLFDARYLTAIIYNRYLTFANAFLHAAAGDTTGELITRFTGYPGPYAMFSPLDRRFLQLSSIRYLATLTPFVERESTLTSQILEQNAARRRTDIISRSAFVLDGRGRDVLFQHPPSRRLPLTTIVPSDAAQLRVAPAIDPKLAPGCGDGVTFQIELDDPVSGAPRMLYERYINPKAAPAAQHWSDGFVDLKPYAGRQVHLLFSTNGGPRGDTACDWAGWGDLRFVSLPADKEVEASTPQFRLVFHDAADVFEYPFSLPRASLFSSVVLANSPQAALDILKRPDFDPWRQVVVEASPSDVAPMLRQAPEIARAAHIESYDAERVVVHADSSEPTILLLTDSNYPGWKATVDGHPATILKANYLFRGVLLPAGSHRVEFQYSPVSYAVGYGISLLSALVAAAWVFRDRRRKTTQGTAARLEPVQAYAKY
jgi:hypothetical protein